MTMDVRALQRALGVGDDGEFGPISRAALANRFTNRRAAPIGPDEIAAFAARLGCSVKQLRAVATVESAGSGFDTRGRPTLRFERHKFHQFTAGRWSVAPFSNPQRGGGGGEDAWTFLADGCAHDPDAAFKACSWGKFQVMGFQWEALGFASAFDLAVSTVAGEAAHYELLARYVEAMHLEDELRALSPDPRTCVAFARAYNGSAYADNHYDQRLAGAMA